MKNNKTGNVMTYETLKKKHGNNLGKTFLIQIICGFPGLCLRVVQTVVWHGLGFSRYIVLQPR